MWSWNCKAKKHMGWKTMAIFPGLTEKFLQSTLRALPLNLCHPSVPPCFILSICCHFVYPGIQVIWVVLADLLVYCAISRKPHCWENLSKKWLYFWIKSVPPLGGGNKSYICFFLVFSVDAAGNVPELSCVWGFLNDFFKLLHTILIVCSLANENISHFWKE